MLADTAEPAHIYRGISMDDLGQALLLQGLRFVQVPIDGKGVVANERFDVSDGVEWSVLGYACENEEGCSELQLRSVFQAQKDEAVVLSRVNDWNASNRFTRAYVMDGVNVILEMDIYLRGGQTLENINEQIIIWRQSARRFSSTMAPAENNP